jgi:predicted DNA-binding protein
VRLRYSKYLKQELTKPRDHTKKLTQYFIRKEIEAKLTNFFYCEYKQREPKKGHQKQYSRKNVNIKLLMSILLILTDTHNFIILRKEKFTLFYSVNLHLILRA